ncbi:phosphodiester glycosidase family protein [Demequina sp.]|uniref:phosphodiester glycosidase family protein n=1 Tax=Demequina sp. TaxID=2050685 RepID=UPI003A83E17F
MICSPTRPTLTGVLTALGLAALSLTVLSACSAEAPVAPTVTVTATPGVSTTAGNGDTAGEGTSDVSEDVIPVDTMRVEHGGGAYGVVTLDMAEWDVRVEWDPQSEGVLLSEVIEADPSIAVATNAGIFTTEMRPGGLLVADGEELVGLNLADGGGNFHLKPNAVFAVLDDGTATVVNSEEYDPAGVVQATQSGPALLLDGEVHPEFREGSTNLALRSGVGVSPDGTTVYLAISSGLTNLWDFATMFRDELGVEDALYLDGQISDLWVSGMSEPGVLSGPYAGVITARPRS